MMSVLESYFQRRGQAFFLLSRRCSCHGRYNMCRDKLWTFMRSSLKNPMLLGVCAYLVSVASAATFCCQQKCISGRIWVIFNNSEQAFSQADECCSKTTSDRHFGGCCKMLEKNAHVKFKWKICRSSSHPDK